MKQLRKKTETRRFLAETAELLRDVDLVFVLQDWSDAYNVGGLFRVADACGATKVVTTGRTPVPPHPQISVTSLGNHRRVAHEHFARQDDALKSLRDQGYKILAIEVADNAQPYGTFDYPDKVALVLGNEAKGIYPGTLRACDAAIFVPMAGKGRSMNVMVTAAVVAFHILRDA